MTDQRGRKPPSVDIGPAVVGVRFLEGALILDARWRLPFHRSTEKCTGHCLSLCWSVITHEHCLASILQFAAALHTERRGLICCSYAKHRSVASANILRHCFGIPVDLSLASRERCAECCRSRAADNVALMLAALRTLPTLEASTGRSLAYALRLPP